MEYLVGGCFVLMAICVMCALLCIWHVVKINSQMVRQSYPTLTDLSKTLTHVCVALSTEKTKEIVASGIAQGERAAAMASIIQSQNAAVERAMDNGQTKPQAPDPEDLPYADRIPIGVASNQESYEDTEDGA